MTPDPVGAFCAYDLPPPPHARNGALAGLTFGVKDLYDIAGWPTGAGSPEWLATHPVPTATAPAVARLLAAGGLCVGKTHTDELAWSLFGQNHHYGTPQNVAAPGRIPGGSSSGSAAATAAGLVDFALGSDTGGSVRLPASFCGLYGIRTTHGRIPLEGAVALAPSFDTAGWFARDAGIFARVGAAILGEARPAAPVRRALWAEDLFEFAGEDVSAALRPLQALFGKVEAVSLAEGALLAWRDAFRVVQSSEVWATHGEWVTRFQPTLGPGIRERFAAASRLDPAEIAQAKVLREAVRRRLAALLPPGVVLLAPSAPGAAPRLDAGAAEMEDFRARALALLCPAGHAGLPQVSLPLASLEGCPLGLSVLAAPGEDETLLELARRVRAE